MARIFRCPALLFLAVAQLVLAFAPLADAKQNGGSRAHVEAAGTALHYSHNEADCSACVARALLSSSRLESPQRPDVAATSVERPVATSLADATGAATYARSRAPPLNRA